MYSPSFKALLNRDIDRRNRAVSKANSRQHASSVKINGITGQYNSGQNISFGGKISNKRKTALELPKLKILEEINEDD